MANGLLTNRNNTLIMLLIAVLLVSVGCNATRHVEKDKHMLRRTRIVLRSDKVMANRGEIKDNLNRMIQQKPNNYWLGVFPVNIYLYNMRYRRFKDRPDSLLPKYAKRPVIIDTTVIYKSAQNMKSYLFNQGYFYARVTDTITYHRKKATITYRVNAGSNYVINKTNYDVDDSGILRVLQENTGGTAFVKGKEFAFSQTEEERSRLTSVVRNNGYFRFSQENITFKIDTFDKSMFRVASSPFENAINFISQTKSNRKGTIDINVIVRLADDTLAYNKYIVNNVNVYPDYKSAEDLRDSGMIEKTIGDISFRYHDNYVHPKVLYEHIFLQPGKYYSQADYNKSIQKLNELGIFQYIRVQARENRITRDTVDFNIFLNRTKKHDFGTNYEVSSGSTYALGHSVGVNFLDKNLMKGANLLSIGVNGGVELSYNENRGNDVIKHFNILTRYYGVNASIDFPKFLAPVAARLFDNSNLPHTIIGGGENVIDRVDYFRLINTSANFSYSWRQTQTISWGLAPAFINIIRLPVKSDSFQRVLDNNLYLRNSYKENFIEGENISFKFDNIAKKHGQNYSYVKLGFEEAGSIVNIVNRLGKVVNNPYQIQYAQYVKLDLDAAHYFTFPRSVFAFRFYGGIGMPYDKSQTLPYIKQYFAGGPYSLRGWRIRTLGPGSYADTTSKAATSQIDRTGDVKLELNGEYRFPIAPLFAGAIKMNGALFADAGNIWLAKKDASYPGGEFELNRLGQDIAADIGAGTRFDIASFLTLRVDVAIPVKKPYITNNGGWVFNKIDFYNSSWRANNVVFNISIGYPF